MEAGSRYPSMSTGDFRLLPIMDGIVAPVNVPFLTPWQIRQLETKLVDGQMVFYMVRTDNANMEVRAAVISGEKQ